MPALVRSPPWSQDVNGDGIPDILVANSQSNDVYLLPGVGRGFFNDKSPVIYQTGIDPVQLFVGNFDTRLGLDLVTINAGSSDLSFFSGFGPGHTIVSGGLNPTAAVMIDLNHDTYAGLVVINGGSNQVSLLLAGTDGPQIAAILSISSSSNLSDIALGATGDGSAAVYVTREGSEAVTLLTFALNFTLDQPPTSDLLTQNPSIQQVTEFSPLANAPIEMIATLNFVSAEQPASFQIDSNIRNASALNFVSAEQPAPFQNHSNISDEIAFAPVDDDLGSFTDSFAGGTTDLSVDLSVFITGAREVPAGQSLSRWNAEVMSNDSPLPRLELFDFSDIETQRRGQSPEPKSIPPASTSAVPRVSECWRQPTDRKIPPWFGPPQRSCLS